MHIKTLGCNDCWEHSIQFCLHQLRLRMVIIDRSRGCYIKYPMSPLFEGACRLLIYMKQTMYPFCGANVPPTTVTSQYPVLGDQCINISPQDCSWHLLPVLATDNMALTPAGELYENGYIALNLVSHAGWRGWLNMGFILARPSEI